MGVNDPPGCSQFGPKGQDLCRVPLEHCYILNIQPCGFRIFFFHVIHIISLLQIVIPPGRCQFGPQEHGWQDL